MSTTIIQANLAAMGLNLAYAFLALFVGIFAFRALDRFMFPHLDFIQEIKKGNIAAGIVIAACVLFVGMLLSNAVR